MRASTDVSKCGKGGKPPSGGEKREFGRCGSDFGVASKAAGVGSGKKGGEHPGGGNIIIGDKAGERDGKGTFCEGGDSS